MGKTYDNSGILYRNERKQKDTHPDYAGHCTIGGIAYWMSGWKKSGDKGPFLSLAFKPKEAQEPPPQCKTDSGSIEDLQDDIPF